MKPDSTTRLLADYDRIMAGCRAVLQAKNRDYAGLDLKDDPWANFTACEKLGICPAEVGFLVRALDKVMRLRTLALTGRLAVRAETGLDACDDLINYFALLRAYLERKAARRPRRRPVKPLSRHCSPRRHKP